MLIRRKIGLACILIGSHGLTVVATLAFSGVYSGRWEHWPFVMFMILGSQLTGR